MLRDLKLGDYEVADRPVEVSSKNTRIPGKAMAVCQHLRLMPYFVWRILRGNVPASDAIDLMVILARMQEYLMADKLRLSDTDNFEDLVVDFFTKRKICEEIYTSFGRITPKYHHLGMNALKLYNLEI